MIRSAVVFDGAELARVSEFNGRSREQMDAGAWSEPEHDDIRRAIKTHYIAQQSTRCCYCDRHLGTINHRDWDIEHIVSRATHPFFMFEPRNLAVACHDCNGAKSDQRVLRNDRRVTYPSEAGAFLIVHPHFDNYDEHIIYRDFIYVGKSEKGKRTIYVCDLLRFAQRFIDWSSSIADKRFEEDVDDLMSGGASAPGALRRIASQLE